MKKLIVVALLLVNAVTIFAQQAPKLYGALPTQRQLNWQETEMYCIVHFSMATYTDKEWGYGDEDPKIFNPAHFSALQIVSAAKAGGFKGIVVVAKHHDGFCLWPTKTTSHNISASPYKNGKGDIVKEYQEACIKLGVKMGIYCSPWDRNNPMYGQPAYVTEVYRKQLEELYANYGPLFMSWHDGANGGDGYYGGTRELRKIDRSTYYGWDTTWGITRKMQPGAAIFGDAGPDVRWVGNEEGHAGETYWETFTPHSTDGKRPANGNVKYEESTEGTRNGKYWIPAECDVPSRPGWFYHEAQDGQTKSPYTLLDLYYKSVGRGACLDLGLSPDKDGQLTNEDVQSLKQFGSIIKQTFAVNLLKGATLKAGNVRGNNAAKFGTAFLLDNNRYSYWATDDAVTKPELIADMHTPKTFNVIRLRENIKLGQRIESVAVDAWQNNTWKEIATATSVGANRLIRLPQNITATKVRLRITASPVCIALSDFGLFKEPVHLSAPEILRSIKGELSIKTEAPVSSIHYTTDGTEPGLNSPVYNELFAFDKGGIVKAVSFEGQEHSEVKTQVFGVSKAGWTILPGQTADKFKRRVENLIDEDPHTIYNTCTKNDSLLFQPQEISVDLGQRQAIKAFVYLPRQDKNKEGIVDSYIYQVSNDGQHWTPAAEGEFSNIASNPIEQTVKLNTPVSARYFKFIARHVISGNGIAVAELGVL
ncbi:alpha-L-fucosidase [Mucilaginibacter sabulilitoris]|uniref:alpha-L-fucosidase n=1 Tax=Mucilaginibacter sabulilitoris TaxID=1173583 RepID=A0ABZ0TRG7_9SPHI|nr:alpha-L-fucosidase [Mucilaginibacter sabulilitoris]WPU95032.1 alpha-L-fucosidase [Mucilaginibacter sabulilitoris]